MRKKFKQKIAVALSGGVDSAVAAFLLKQQGYDICALYLNLFSEDPGVNRARIVAEALKVPFYQIDGVEEFKKAVIDYFLNEYKEGRTPNPCVECNRNIKFGLLFKRAMDMGFDQLATGHYIKIESKPPHNKMKGGGVEYHLHVARDKEKDQSYFLYNLTQEILSHMKFPLGNYKKEAVKNMAVKLNLPVEKKESQDICFLANPKLYIGEGEHIIPRKADHNEFLKKYLPLEGGDIITCKGKKIGRHQGLPLYTIGQRRAVGIGGSGPYYVIAKDIKKNILIVSEDKDDPRLYSEELKVGKVNWVSGEKPRLPLKIKAKIRYRHNAEIATISSTEKKNTYLVKFKTSQRAVTPGQSVVFYKGDELIGGGIIIIT